MWYYGGHGSAWVVVVFAAVFILRAVMGRRRMGQGSRSGRSDQTGGGWYPNTTTTAPERTISTSRPASFRGIPPGWLPDPSGRHQQRYWSGLDWTDHVTDDGVPGIDPLPAPPQPKDAATTATPGDATVTPIGPDRAQGGPASGGTGSATGDQTPGGAPDPWSGGPTDGRP
jgi:hypothetical protein